MREIRYQTANTTIIGNRSTNQDRCTLIESINSVLICLADGMGGHPKGEVAAQILMDVCTQAFTEARKPIPNPASFLVDTMNHAHEQIIAYGKAQNPAIKPRTTAVVALIQDNIVYWAHAGDSRFYLFRGKKILARTTDHSYVELLRKQGAITPSECASHPQRNYVTRCLGGNMLSVDFSHGKPTPLLPGDILLLCSDGLWGALDNSSLVRGICTDEPLTERIKQLTKRAASTAAPESDNVTAIALQWIEGITSIPLDKLTSSPTSNADTNNQKSTLNKAVDDLRNTIKSFKP